MARILLQLFISLGLVLSGQLLHAQSAASAVGKILDSRGIVELQRANQTAWTPVSPPMDVYAGDEIRTGPNGKATLLLADESAVQINRQTRLQLKEVGGIAGWNRMRGLVQAASGSVRSVYRLFTGELWIRNNSPEADIDIETPTVTAGLRGTELSIRVEHPQQVNIAVLEGAMLAFNAIGQLDAVAGEMVVTRLNSAPQKRVLLRPLDSVQWTIRLPELLTASPAGRITPIQQTVERLYAGDIREAQTLARALVTKDPANELGWQTLALASLMLNDGEQSEAAIQSALNLNARSANTWTIAGYVQQSKFQLQTARQHYQNALAVDASHLQARLALATIEFADHRLDALQRTLEQAQAQAPNDSDVNALQGFYALARFDTQAALAAFNTAVRNDPGNADAYLGLALSHMRQNDSATALQSIASAVALQPQRSHLLSYWGKMLYQEQRFDKAFTVLQSAARLDALDPTPHYYRSIMERDLYRAGESIASLNRALALNDNRAVYRSRYLLDRDNAARSIDLSNLYSALGLNAWAQSLAIDSVQQDYSNASAHLFLGNALIASGDRTYPASAENFMTRLLLPANLNSLSSFNDYTTFFETPDLSSSISIGTGTQSSRTFNAIFSGAQPQYNLAYSAIYTDFDSDGSVFEDAQTSSVAGSDNRSLGATVKWQPSPNHNLLVSTSLSDQRALPLFLQTSVDTTSETTTDIDSDRFESGYHYRINNELELMAAVSYLDIEVKLGERIETDFGDGIVVRQDALNLAERPYLQTQIQLAGRRAEHQWILGALSYDGEKTAVTELKNFALFNGDVIPFPEFDLMASAEFDVEFNSVYLRDRWQLQPNFELDVSLYYESLDNANPFLNSRWSVEEWSPRLGLTWTLNEHQKIRLAGFQYLLPFVSPRLDPTNVSGLFVVRNTEEGARVREVDLAWEYRWDRGYFSATGFYLERLQIDRPAPGSPLRELDARSRGGELTGELLLSEYLGLSAQLQHEDIRNESLPLNDRDEWLAVVRLQFLHPSGWFGGLSHTHRDIRLENRSLVGSGETIALTDLNLGILFPGRKGQISLNVLNLFDERFRWLQDGFELGQRAAERQVSLQASLYF